MISAGFIALCQIRLAFLLSLICSIFTLKSIILSYLKIAKSTAICKLVLSKNTLKTIKHYSYCYPKLNLKIPFRNVLQNIWLHVCKFYILVLYYNTVGDHIIRIIWFWIVFWHFFSIFFNKTITPTKRRYMRVSIETCGMHFLLPKNIV